MVYGGASDLIGVIDIEQGTIANLIEVKGGGVTTSMWSPDGRWIAVELGLASGLNEIDFVEAVTGDRPIAMLMRRAFHSADVETRRPKWSIDSKYIYFIAKRLGETNESTWSVSPDGSGVQR